MQCMITTGSSFEGYKITAYHDIITAEEPMTTSLKDNAGKWEAVRHKVYKELVNKLPEGANAIIGLQVAHNYFQGVGIASQFYFFATGTAVTIEKL